MSKRSSKETTAVSKASSTVIERRGDPTQRRSEIEYERESADTNKLNVGEVGSLFLPAAGVLSSHKAKSYGINNF